MPRRVPIVDPVLPQAIPAVRPQRFQDAVARSCRRRCCTITIDLSTSPVSRSRVSSSVAAVLAAHAVRRVEVEPAREHRQPHEQGLLGFGEQPVGPVDRRGEALLPRMRSARPPLSRRRLSRRRATSRLLITRIRAAASSIASGRPSSRRQISATAPTGSRSRSKSGRPALARSANNVVASSTASGGTGKIRSPSTPSASRLVASTDTRGQCRTIWSINRAAASRRCSQLSTTSSSSRVRRYSITVASMPRPCCCCNRSAAATAWPTAAPSSSGASLAQPYAVAEALLVTCREPRARAVSCRLRRPRSASTSGPSSQGAASATRRTSRSRPVTKLVARRRQTGVRA